MNFQKVPLAAGLWFVGVPIGTARDITLRALDVLASADMLVAEDTRSLRHLMDIHGVPLSGRPLLALHDHSGEAVIRRVLDAVREGQAVACASEAGMPLIADPGFELVRAAREDGLMVTSAPGPSAVITALALAGLPTDAFFFAGFLPNAKTARRAALDVLRGIPGTLAFYESPKRLAAMLLDCAEVLGDGREAAVCRELTKKFEEITRGSLGDLREIWAGTKPKGEIVVLIDRARSPDVSTSDISGDLTAALAKMSMRDAVDMVSRAHEAPRRKVYQMALDMTKE